MIKNSRIWIGLALVFLTSGCFKEDDYDRVEGADLVQVIVDPSVQLPANGSSFSLVKIVLSDKAIPSRRTVVLKTDLGSFAGGKGDSILVTADDNFQAAAKLVSTKPGKATVSAVVAGLKTTAVGKIEFLQAWPDQVEVTVDSFSVSNSFKSEALISASLRSGNGVSSSNQLVSFTVFDPAGQPIGSFMNGINTAESDLSGKAKIRFSAGVTGITGKLTIVAETKKQDLSPIIGTTYIYLTP